MKQLVRVIVKGRCNANLPKTHPDFCQGDCCHYCGEAGYGPDIQEALAFTGSLKGIPYSIRDFARDFSYTGVYKTGIPYYDDSFRNPKGLLGGCRFQNSDGSCQLHLRDEREGTKYHKPNACRRFPIGGESWFKEKLRSVGDKYPLNRIWKKCGYVLEVE